MGNKKLFNEKNLNYIKNYMELLTFVTEANYILDQIIFCKHSTKRMNGKNALEFGKTVFFLFEMLSMYRETTLHYRSMGGLGRIQMV